MSCSRRGFLIGTTTTVLGLAAASHVRSAVAQCGCCSGSSESQAVLKLSSQLSPIPGKELQAKLATMEKWGFDGVELPGDIVGKEELYENAVKNTKLTFSAVCFGSMNGALVSEDEKKRGPAAEQLKRVLTAAGALKSTGARCTDGPGC